MILKEIAGVASLVPHVQIGEKICEQAVIVPVPQVAAVQTSETVCVSRACMFV